MPKKTFPSRMIATNNASSLSASGIWAGLFTLAKSTLTPFCNMGVITIKMISSTSITSTMGVTLILALTFAPSSRLEIAIGLPLAMICTHSPWKQVRKNCVRMRRRGNLGADEQLKANDLLLRNGAFHAASRSNQSVRSRSCPSPRRRLPHGRSGS